jgi:spoIIIJ-associated protein
MAAIEVSAPDIESAIEQGLQQLDLIRAEVKIEVLEEGSRGVLGIGAKPARVRLTPFAEIEATATATTSAAAPANVTSQSSAAVVDAEEDRADSDSAEDQHEGEGEGEGDQDNADSADDAAPKIEGEDVALGIVRGLLERMGLRRARAEARSVFPADSDDEPSIWIDIDVEERDEELFLGHQHEGLSAMQTIVQTMWSHQNKSSLRVNIDVNGYRARREQQLVNMARRMAERVVVNGKPITLEPMPASERRIVHMALRDDPSVFTESTGEGSARKIQIKPKK